MNGGSIGSGGVVVRRGLLWLPSVPASVLGLMVGLEVGCSRRPPISSQLQELQGTWSGVVANDKSGARYEVRIAGDTLNFRRDSNFWFSTTLVLPPDARPKRFEATILSAAPGQESALGKTVVAIFKIEDGMLVLAARGDGDDNAPTSFDEPSDSGLTRYELRRVGAGR